MPHGIRFFLFVMLKNLISSLLAACIMPLMGGNLSAQKGLELGAWLGASHYFGDLNNLYAINEPGLAFGLTGRYNFDTRLSTRLQLNYHRIAGDDVHSRNAFDQRRNLRFYSDVIEIAPCVEFNFFPLVHGSKEQFASPYVYVGLSVFHYNPKATLQGETYALRDFGTEGQLPGQEYNEISSAWLLGFGIKVDISYSWSLNIDLGYRMTRTDFLDDVSGYYPDYTELAINRDPIAVALADRSIPDPDKPAIGIPGSQRGDHNENDQFVSLGVNLVYYFGKLRCPPISYPGGQ